MSCCTWTNQPPPWACGQCTSVTLQLFRWGEKKTVHVLKASSCFHTFNRVLPNRLTESNYHTAQSPSSWSWDSVELAMEANVDFWGWLTICSTLLAFSSDSSQVVCVTCWWDYDSSHGCIFNLCTLVATASCYLDGVTADRIGFFLLHYQQTNLIVGNL